MRAALAWPCERKVLMLSHVMNPEIASRTATNVRPTAQSMCAVLFSHWITCAPVSTPPIVPTTSIYTKADGVVDWRCCLEDDDEANIEVRGTHVGLAFNAQVYRKVAEVLAAATT